MDVGELQLSTEVEQCHGQRQRQHRHRVGRRGDHRTEDEGAEDGIDPRLLHGLRAQHADDVQEDEDDGQQER